MLSASPLRTALLIAAVGDAAILLGLFGSTIEILALGVVIAGVVGSAPHAPEPGAIGPRWWPLLAVGAALLGVGIGLGFAVESVGGLVAVLGGVLVAAGVGLGWPER